MPSPTTQAARMVAQQVSKFIQDSRVDAIAQQLRRRSDPIRHPCGHSWFHGAPLAW